MLSKEARSRSCATPVPEFFAVAGNQGGRADRFFDIVLAEPEHRGEPLEQTGHDSANFAVLEIAGMIIARVFCATIVSFGEEFHCANTTLLLGFHDVVGKNGAICNV